jgi:hypothetical protein
MPNDVPMTYQGRKGLTIIFTVQYHYQLVVLPHRKSTFGVRVAIFRDGKKCLNLNERMNTNTILHFDLNNSAQSFYDQKFLMCHPRK